MEVCKCQYETSKAWSTQKSQGTLLDNVRSVNALTVGVKGARKENLASATRKEPQFAGPAGRTATNTIFDG